MLHRAAARTGGDPHVQDHQHPGLCAARDDYRVRRRAHHDRRGPVTPPRARSGACVRALAVCGTCARVLCLVGRVHKRRKFVIAAYTCGGHLNASLRLGSKRKKTKDLQSRRYLMRISDSDFLVDGWHYASGIGEKP
eukprot:6231222-Prymnesium_polylepis.1